MIQLLRRKSNNKDNIDILLMSDNGLDTVGGEQESTKIIINGAKDHFSLGVIQPGSMEQPETGVHYYPLTHETRIKHFITNPIAFIKYVWQVKRIVNREKPKIIHTQAQVSFFIAALLRKLKLIPNNVRLIHTERGLYTKYNKFIKKIFYFFMKELDTLVTTTEFNMKYWKSAIQKKKLPMDYKVIENTAGELFESYDRTREKRDENKLVVGFAGRYADWKNWPLAVEISKKLNETLGSNLYVNMAVGCLDENAKTKTEKLFNDLSKTLGSRFNGRINISLEEMDKLYYDIDVFILTSNYNTESFGRTLVEAMSRKTVVLTTDAGGSVEVVGNQDNVCGTADKFVERVLRCNKNREFMEEEKERNLRRVKRKYSLNNNVTKHLELYNCRY